MAFEDFLSGAGKGASAGGAIGSIDPGIGTAIGSGIGGLLGGAAGGLFGRKKEKETETQKKQRELVDQLLGSLKGQGPFSGLFQADEAAFQKSFVEPAKQRFQSQIAPQIQQSFIAGGQQRGTGLEDQLARAGVDMDQMLNQQFMQQQQQAQQRQLGAIGTVLGQGPGAAPQQSSGQAALQGLGGFLSTPAFGADIGNILSSFQGRAQAPAGADSLEDRFLPPRKGFENQPQVYNPYTGVQQ